MFQKILIANRGEIACRVAATARRMGIKTVAVYSDADAHAKHVAACDEAVHIGGSAPKDSYLRWERILDAAKATGAQAIHPGYGFLSENEDFARACFDAGLVFIGPPASAIADMGLKAESKRLMHKAGVPLVPGYQGEDQDPQLLHREADGIGYPVLIKASAGGGGKGMRLVEKSEDFAAALDSCKREAINSFGNDAVLVEKYVLRPRHIEIQVFGDTQGNVVYLFERDCSTQRRHQKVLEEAPAPGMPPALRQQMGEAAVAAAKAVGYVGAGTVEFIVEQPGGYEQPEAMKFYFMEMNTRLQVEHPVTEAITGEDLVEWQLRVAAGQPLPKRQDELKIIGHAIEARICAENPDNQFLPATGTLHVYCKPQAKAFERGTPRIDDGVRHGDAISPFYDSMIAKLIVHGDTREQALARLDDALAQTHIVGLATNVQFLRYVVRSDAFRHAQLDTALIQREAAQLFDQEPVGLPLAAAAAVAALVSRASRRASKRVIRLASATAGMLGSAAAPLCLRVPRPASGRPGLATASAAPRIAWAVGSGRRWRGGARKRPSGTSRRWKGARWKCSLPASARAPASMPRARCCTSSPRAAPRASRPSIRWRTQAWRRARAGAPRRPCRARWCPLPSRRATRSRRASRWPSWRP